MTTKTNIIDILQVSVRTTALNKCLETPDPDILI